MRRQDAGAKGEAVKQGIANRYRFATGCTCRLCRTNNSAAKRIDRKIARAKEREATRQEVSRA